MKRILLTFLTVAALLAAASARANFDCYLRLAGVAGESIAQGHAGEIDIAAFDVGIIGGPPAPGGGTSGPPQFRDLGLTKMLDKASPLLMLKCAQGATIADATLTCRKASADPVVFYRILLKGVRVTNISTGGSAGSGVPMETFSLSYDEIEWEYTPTLANGSQGKPIIHRWNLKTGSGS